MGLQGLGVLLDRRRSGLDTSLPPRIFVENVPLVIDDRRVAVCMVEKCGSTRWKMLYERAMGYNPETILARGFLPHNSTMYGVPETMEGYFNGLISSERPSAVGDCGMQCK